METKPELEVKILRSLSEIAIFPLVTPSIASPGAMMTVALLTENNRRCIPHQMVTNLLMLLIIVIVYVLMLFAGKISKIISEGGASIVNRVIGLVLASIEAANLLEGIKEYFKSQA